MTKKQAMKLVCATCRTVDPYLMTTEQLMKASLLILHLLLIAFAVPAMMGKASPDLVSMFDSTLAAILWNLGVLGGNKAVQKIANRFGKEEAEK